MRGTYVCSLLYQLLWPSTITELDWNGLEWTGLRFYLKKHQVPHGARGHLQTKIFTLNVIVTLKGGGGSLANEHDVNF